MHIIYASPCTVNTNVLKFMKKGRSGHGCRGVRSPCLKKGRSLGGYHIYIHIHTHTSLAFQDQVVYIRSDCSAKTICGYRWRHPLVPLPSPKPEPEPNKSRIVFRQVGPITDLKNAQIEVLVPAGAIPYSKRPGFEELGRDLGDGSAG